MSLSAGDPETADDPLLDEAASFVKMHPWCCGIETLALVFDGSPWLAIYDSTLIGDEGARWEAWVLVGDVPPTMIPHEDFDGLHAALEAQILGFEAWADAVDRGEKDLTPYTPVMYRHSVREVEPTFDMARAVRDKSKMLREQVLPNV